MNKLIAVCCALCASAAMADKLTMKSGSVLTGTPGEIKNGVLTFTSDDFGVLQIATDKIANLDEKVYDAQQVAFVPPPKEPEVWHGSINLSISAARGNTVSDKAAVIANVNRRWDDDRLTADAAYYFAKSGKHTEEQTKSEDRVFLAAQEDHFWSKNLYSYVNGKFEKDNILELERRFRLGTGLGYQWLEKQDLFGIGEWSVNQEAGLEYVSEKWKDPTPGAEEDFCAFRYAHHVTYVPSWCSSLSWFHNLEYHPDVAEWSEIYTVNTDIGFTTVIYKGWDLLAKIEWDFQNTPSKDAKKSDVRYIVGFGYKW